MDEGKKDCAMGTMLVDRPVRPLCSELVLSTCFGKARKRDSTDDQGQGNPEGVGRNDAFSTGGMTGIPSSLPAGEMPSRAIVAHRQSQLGDSRPGTAGTLSSTGRH